MSGQGILGRTLNAFAGKDLRDGIRQAWAAKKLLGEKDRLGLMGWGTQRALLRGARQKIKSGARDTVLAYGGSIGVLGPIGKALYDKYAEF